MHPNGKTLAALALGLASTAWISQGSQAATFSIAPCADTYIEPYGSEPDPPQGAELVDGDPELAQVVEAWADLPEAIRAAMVTLVKAAGPGQR